MTQIGTSAHPLRVAVIGAGPAGFYAAGHLLKQSDLVIQVDLYDRLPTPHGLVRAGVAPDHQKIKNVIRVYDKIADHPNFRFFGNVDIGVHVSLEDLKAHYHQICFSTGAQVDRSLGIPGEDLQGCHSATAFVAWYNGHPDYRDLTFDLSHERIAIVGVGNVAVDIARILSKSVDELARTDIADHALEVLRESKVRALFMLGRRGPAQAAFTNPEARELGELEQATTLVRPDEAALDPLSLADLEANPDRTTQTKLELIQGFVREADEDKPRKLHLRFLVSPTEIYGDGSGHVAGIRLVKNELYRAENGTLRPRSTDQFEDLPVGLVFRSVGYRGVALPGLPFHERWGVILNEAGRVVEAQGTPVTGLYTSGWIKRGPTGVIGTNKACSVETVEGMLEDFRAGRLLSPTAPEPESAEGMIHARQPDVVSFNEWKKLDALEVAKGEPDQRPRVKFVRVEEMLGALDRG